MDDEYTITQLQSPEPDIEGMTVLESSYSDIKSITVVEIGLQKTFYFSTALLTWTSPTFAPKLYYAELANKTAITLYDTEIATFQLFKEWLEHSVGHNSRLPSEGDWKCPVSMIRLYIFARIHHIWALQSRVCGRLAALLGICSFGYETKIRSVDCILRRKDITPQVKFFTAAEVDHIYRNTEETDELRDLVKHAFSLCSVSKDVHDLLAYPKQFLVDAIQFSSEKKALRRPRLLHFLRTTSYDDDDDASSVTMHGDD